MIIKKAWELQNRIELEANAWLKKMDPIFISALFGFSLLVYGLASLFYTIFVYDLDMVFNGPWPIAFLNPLIVIIVAMTFIIIAILDVKKVLP